MEAKDESYRIAKLILKYLRQRLNTAEAEELENWKTADKRNAATFEQLGKRYYLSESYRFFEETDLQKGLENVRQKISRKTACRNKRLFRIIRSGIAALVAGICITVVLWKFSSEPVPASLALYTPDRNAVQLQLSDGEIVVLSRTSVIKEKDGNAVALNDSSGISYRSSMSPKTSYHTIITPRGTEYLVTLADGSKVWLNSESSLKFPLAFDGKIRRVELTGEGYFEVKKDTVAPFVVNCRDIEIQVTGTSFNVMSYPDDSITQAALVEGAVNVSCPGRPEITPVCLLPRQLVTYSHETGTLAAADTDITPYIAWHEGYICFNYETLGKIARKLERWYDIRFEFDEPSTRELIFYGSIKRHENITQVLNMLKYTNLIDFTILNSKTIQISKN